MTAEHHDRRHRKSRPRKQTPPDSALVASSVRQPDRVDSSQERLEMQIRTTWEPLVQAVVRQPLTGIPNLRGFVPETYWRGTFEGEGSFCTNREDIQPIRFQLRGGNYLCVSRLERAFGCLILEFPEPRDMPLVALHPNYAARHTPYLEFFRRFGQVGHQHIEPSDPYVPFVVQTLASIDLKRDIDTQTIVASGRVPRDIIVYWYLTHPPSSVLEIIDEAARSNPYDWSKPLDKTARKLLPPAIKEIAPGVLDYPYDPTVEQVMEALRSYAASRRQAHRNTEPGAPFSTREIVQAFLALTSGEITHPS